MTPKAAIYHFTDGSEKRPIVYETQIKTLGEFAESRGFDVVAVFCDKSLRRCDRHEFDRLTENCEQYDVLIVKDFYHLSKNTKKCMEIMKGFREKGISIYSVENGIFIFEEEPFDKPLKVVTYNSRFGEADPQKQIVTIQNDTMKLFTKLKTNWSVKDQFFDEGLIQNDGAQINLHRIIEQKEDYDLLLVPNLTDVHWRTSNFCKIREALQMDIYSLQDGFLKYRREKGI